MPLIYIDTNVYLDFYQSATERLEVLAEIERCGKNIVITMQTVDEFLRSRVQRLDALASAIEKSTAGNVHATALVRELPEFSKIVEHQKAIKQLSESMVATLHSWMEVPEGDAVFAAFVRVGTSATLVTHTDETLQRAQKRKLVGNPPTSSDKHTIGNELIWETLVEFAKDDLIIVSRDHTFTTNTALLKAEYSVVTGKQLLAVTPRLSDALKMIGAKSEKVEQAEKQIAEAGDDDALTRGTN